MCSAATSPATSPATARTCRASTLFAAIDPRHRRRPAQPHRHRAAEERAHQPGPQRRRPDHRQHLRPARHNQRPLPAGSLPDIGSVEINQPLSTSPTANNDVITGSNAANNLVGPRRQRLPQGPGRQRHAQRRRRQRRARRWPRQRQAQRRQRRRHRRPSPAPPRSWSTSPPTRPPPSAAARPTR